MKNQTRRSFLKTTLAATATVSWTAKSWSQVKGANEYIRCATVGINGRGRSHMSYVDDMNPEGVKMVALCDVDATVLAKGVDRYNKSDKLSSVEGVGDLRRLFERKDIDVVTVATPNHWHSLAAIWAIQAGKDVYVEKPVSHNVWEGRQLVRAARKYGKICQTGTQARSSSCIREAVQYVQEGNLGKIKVARGLCYKLRPSIGHSNAPQKVPEGVDYNLWSGPAPLVPPTRNQKKNGPIHYDWHWVWHYGNGDLGNQGIHQMDISRWFLGEDRLSPRVWSVGGRMGYVDDGETPNTQIVYHDYEKAPLVFEVRGLTESPESKDQPKYKDAAVGVIIECENGYVAVRNYRTVQAYDWNDEKIMEWKGEQNHFENFINAVHSRKHTDLNADIWEGHLSSALCHTGNISYRLGSAASREKIEDVIKPDYDASGAFERMAEHLGKHSIDLKKTPLTLGPSLIMDPKVEKFIGNEDADALLRREYREPFVVPERV